MLATQLGYCFSQEDAQRAYEGWGANCGPNALAFACRLHLDALRGVIPGFAEKRYTNPTMMKAALAALGRRWADAVADKEMMFRGTPAELVLTRVQWGGPWTGSGASQRWAYSFTHQFACWREPAAGELVFDCNGGIVPALTREIKRADGTWFPTHTWRILEADND